MSKRPNVIFVLTDDQGYGDLACTGNPNIKTPNIDAFYGDCARFSDFHVAPLCAPTRGALMTGRRPLRNGVWATCWGRSILKHGEYTIAECLSDNGYNTGMFGKWHLGDNYPSRPEDKGFERVVAHKGGGVGQTPDFWGNNYFDDTYFANGKPTEYEGYCTDVWFDQAKKFILDNKDSDKPFFAYIATNAPHGPYLVDEKYSTQYKNNPDIVNPEFYGMITNIDENFGRLRDFLQENNLEDDTILMFMTDNGTSAGFNRDENYFVKCGFNAGMRGAKGSYYEGGHRVPFFMRWKNGNITGGYDIESLSMATDFFPTIAELCGADNKRAGELDGVSLVPQIKGEKQGTRTEFLQYRQDTVIPEKWTNAVLRDEWRLISGTELYNVKDDPEQRNDIADKHPEIVKSMRKAHEIWWDEIYEDVQKYSSIVLGNDAENPAVLNAMDVLGDVAWHHVMVASNADTAGKWYVKFDQKGKYRISLMRWPEEINKRINEAMAQEEIEKLAPYLKLRMTALDESIKYQKVTLNLFGKDYEKEIEENDTEITFIVDVDSLEETVLTGQFVYDNDKHTGVYYATVERL